MSGPHPFISNGKWGYLDGHGRVVIPAQFDLAGWFEGGTAAVRMNSFWTFIDEKGAERPGLVFSFRPETPFREGRLAAAADDSGKFGFVSSLGEVIIAQRFERALPFAEGVAAVKEGGTWSFIGLDA